MRGFTLQNVPTFYSVAVVMYCTSTNTKIKGGANVSIHSICRVVIMKRISV